MKRNINEKIQYSFLTNFSNCTVNNKLIILIFSSNRNSVVVFLCQMRSRYMEIKLLYSRKKSIMLFVFRSRHMLFYTEQSHGHCNSNQQHQSLHVVVHWYTHGLLKSRYHVWALLQPRWSLKTWAYSTSGGGGYSATEKLKCQDFWQFSGGRGGGGGGILQLKS